MIEVDKLCNGLVSRYTPRTDVTYAYVIHPHSLKPNDPKWEQPVQDWWKNY
jgi:hypothetical protein